MVSLGALCRQYLLETNPSHEPSTQYQNRCFYRMLVQQIGDVPVESLTPARLRQWKVALAQHHKPTTIHKYLSRLDALLRYAIECEYLVKNPLATVRKPSLSSEGRVRFLSADERQRLLAACRVSRNPLLYAVVVVALGTGGRKNEVRRLRWEQVDLEGGQVRFIKTKSHRARAVPLVGETLTLLTALQAQRRLAVPWVFPSWRGTEPVIIESAWETARAHAGLLDFHLHDLRHTYASYLAMSGVPLRTIADLLGHANIQMTMRYCHLMPSVARASVEAMAQRFLT